MVLAATLRRATNARRQGRVDEAAERQLEAAFACSRQLAAYGTLRPGQVHAIELAECPGCWSAGTVTGSLASRHHPVFTFAPSAPPVEVQLLRSDALPEHWARLDAFEGEAYRRILVPVVLATGVTTVANLYEAVQPVA